MNSDGYITFLFYVCFIERVPAAKQGTPKSVSVPGRTVSVSSKKPEITVQGRLPHSL